MIEVSQNPEDYEVISVPGLFGNPICKIVNGDESIAFEAYVLRRKGTDFIYLYERVKNLIYADEHRPKWTSRDFFETVEYNSKYHWQSWLEQTICSFPYFRSPVIKDYRKYWLIDKKELTDLLKELKDECTNR